MVEEVSLRVGIDARRSMDTVDRDGGAVTFGQNAYKFALAVARAQERIVFRNANGTVVFDAKGSTKAIKRMLEFCGLKQ